MTRYGYLRVLLTVLLINLTGCFGTESPTDTGPVATTVILSAATLSFSSLEDTQQLTATVWDQNGAAMSGASVTWVSSASTVASVSSTGLVAAVSNGTATVTATSGSATGTASVTVQQLAASVTLSPNPLFLAGPADTATVTASVFDAGGSEIANPDVTWSSSDESIATVTNSGLVTAVAEGFVTVTGTTEGFQGITTIAIGVSASISVGITTPQSGARVGDTVSVRAEVQSQFQIASVTATVENREVSLTYSPIDQGWVGTITLDGLARGDKHLVVRATDVFGEFNVASRPFIYDRAPTVSIHLPTPYSVARPDIRVVASCKDDDPDGCVSLTVRASTNQYRLYGGPVVIQVKDTIDANLSLSEYDGKVVHLFFVGRDSGDGISTATVSIYVESSTSLRAVTSVIGQIWDVEPNRILYLDRSSGISSLKIRDRATVTDVVVSGDAVELQDEGQIFQLPMPSFLTPEGALFLDHENVLYEWRSGTLLNHGSVSSLRVSDQFAVWAMGTDLVRYDVVAGTPITVATDANGADVASNGDVVYRNSSFDILRYRGGVTTTLTTDDDAVLWNTSPLTDGINVVYRKHPPCCTPPYQIAMTGASGEEILAGPRLQEPDAERDYQVENGWVAFTKASSDGALQVWVRAPTGEQTQVTFFGQSSKIDALGPNGELTVINDNRRYRWSAASGGAPVEISSSLGRSIWQEGELLVVIGSTVFEVP